MRQPTGWRSRALRAHGTAPGYARAPTHGSCTLKFTRKVPKPRTLPFETAIIERYRRRESSVEEALVEMHLGGVSVRRVEDDTEAMWGTHPYVFLEGLWLKLSWGGEVRNVSQLAGVNDEGFREMLAAVEAEGREGQLDAFLRHMKERGLKGGRLFVSDIVT